MKKFFCKKIFAVVLCAMLLLAGCRNDPEGDPKIPPDTEAPETAGDENAAGSVKNTDTESEKEEITDVEQAQQITAVPDVIFALSEVNSRDLPEVAVIGDALADAIARTVLEQIGEPELLIRVLYVGIPEYYSGTDLHVEYEVYPKNCEKICREARLSDVMQLEIARENGGYAPGISRVYEEERIETLKAVCREGNFIQPGAEVIQYLDRESRVCIENNGEILVTEQHFFENVDELNNKVKWCADGDTVVLLGHESRYYSEPFSIHVSRDGGKTWTETVPELAPLGKNGQHSELGFLEARIQIRESGQIYIFTGTNLSSLNVFTVPADSSEAALLFREQIGGYETTSLVDAAMISDKRGYITLMHPKYAGSNAIYRTTNGGLTWVRCSIPMPEACTNVWEMRLFLPQVQSEWLEWTMVGTWDTGSCTYVSYDGGWTWEIIE